MKIAVATPSHGAPFRRHEKCVRALRLARPDWTFLEFSGPCVDVSRAVLAERAITEEAEMLLWIDADMTFTVETCDTVIKEAHERRALVGCLYAGKKSEALPQVSLFSGTGEMRDGKRVIRCFEGGSVIEVRAIGFGLVAHPVSMLLETARVLGMHRQQAGRDHFVYPWFSNDPNGAMMHSDDYSFCKRARAAGFKIFADTRQRVGHIGEYDYHLEDLAPRTVFSSLDIEHLDTEKE